MQTYHAHLLGTTALVHPTHHKKGVIGKLLGVAISVAIPFAAPAIAGAFAVSAAAQLAIQVAVGAGMGAFGSLVAGGDPLIGAIGGGLAGGLASPASVSGASNAASTAQRAVLRGPSLVAPAAAGPAGIISGPVNLPGNVGGFAPGTPIASNVGAQLTGGVPVFNGDTAWVGGIQPKTSAQLTGGAGNYIPPDAGTQLSEPILSSTPSRGGMGVNTVASSSEPGFFDQVQGYLGDLPDSVKNAGVKTLTSLAAGAFAGDEVSTTAEERLRLGQLAEDREREKSLLANRIAISDGFLQQANAIDPDAFGRQNRNDQLIALRRAQQSSLRGLSNSRSAAQRAGLRRRSALDSARLGGGAFLTARRTEANRQMGLQAAASNTRPTGAGLSSSSQENLKAARVQVPRVAAAEKEASDVFSPLFAGLFRADLEDDFDKKKASGE